MKIRVKCEGRDRKLLNFWDSKCAKVKPFAADPGGWNWRTVWQQSGVQRLVFAAWLQSSQIPANPSLPILLTNPA